MAEKTRIDGMTTEQFEQLWRERGPFELIDGAILDMSPSKYGHIRLIHRLLKLLSDYVLHKALGDVLIEAPFVLPAAGSDPK